MPLVNSDDPALWDGGANSLYSPPYVRDNLWNFYGENPTVIRNALNIQPGQSIIIVGAGFGYMGARWIEQGLGPIVAIDTSAWIQGNKVANADIAILNEDMASNPSRGRVRQALGLSGNQRATWCISEDVVPILSDVEAQDLATRMRIVGTTVAHIITTLTVPGAQDPRLSWKTLEAWKALLTPDLVLAKNENGRVL